jgi:hypothetical protein
MTPAVIVNGPSRVARETDRLNAFVGPDELTVLASQIEPRRRRIAAGCAGAVTRLRRRRMALMQWQMASGRPCEVSPAGSTRHGNPAPLPGAILRASAFIECYRMTAQLHLSSCPMRGAGITVAGNTMAENTGARKIVTKHRAKRRQLNVYGVFVLSIGHKILTFRQCH